MTATIKVDAATHLGQVPYSWTFFGYDEPNYTYTPKGKKLLKELADLSPVPLYLRCHHLLTSGNGQGRLKWGSTNVYSEDADGNPIYDWTIIDQIFDAYVEAGLKPLVQAGFMPKLLSTTPDPYEHNWPEGDLTTGWSYPPTDYHKWAELIYQWVKHCVERYGQSEVETWYWEAWNEPDIFFWSGTLEEFIKLYDFTADAIKRALPTAIVGGPQTTGPENEKGETYLRTFLEHCIRGKNYATGETGSPLDFLGFHTKGRPEWVDGHIQMGMQRAVKRVARGFEIIAEFPELLHLPVILDEADPDGTAAISAAERPENEFKNRSIYPAYNAAVFKKFHEAADRYGVNLRGIGTWAFQFEDQAYFAGFRSLATNGIDKPILNLYRMLGLIRGQQLSVDSNTAVSLEEVLNSGVRNTPDVNAVASAGQSEVTILVWHYHDVDIPSSEADIKLQIQNLPQGQIIFEHFRIDENCSNAHTVWQDMGEPQNPSPEQYQALESSGHLQLFESPKWISQEYEQIEMNIKLPRYGLSLLRFSWS